MAIHGHHALGAGIRGALDFGSRTAALLGMQTVPASAGLANLILGGSFIARAAFVLLTVLEC
eukprot:CAMPEP_0171085244 /NCGR_PEP_ID=MMETSP0766_2-20121228/18820_1 /TAXON_ID=439317 /ORGANISM="Gambierdiscus australes, Strain CAWD 149" /LENGTH=61 /DNA_ID=CAMNT_0011542803 /DNA_START=125 /DNA_END=310 /DNA_ORIENTATION=-